MKTNNPASNRLYCDRPLVSEDAMHALPSASRRWAYPGTDADRVSEIFNTALQMALVACLLVSMLICGWKVGGAPSPSPASAEIAKTQSVKPAAPSTGVVEAKATSATTGYRVQKTTLPRALKLSTKFFLVD